MATILNSVHLDCSWETSYTQPFVPNWSTMLHVPQAMLRASDTISFFFFRMSPTVTWCRQCHSVFFFFSHFCENSIFVSACVLAVSTHLANIAVHQLQCTLHALTAWYHFNRFLILFLPNFLSSILPAHKADFLCNCVVHAEWPRTSTLVMPSTQSTWYLRYRISLTDAGMASELLSNNMRLLSDQLQIKEVDFDLLQARVITDAELQEINAQSKERGDMAGTRCLLLKLLRKSEGQKAAFFACLKERQADLYKSLQRTRVAKHEGTRTDEEDDRREASRRQRHRESASLHGKPGRFAKTLLLIQKLRHTLLQSLGHVLVPFSSQVNVIYHLFLLESAWVLEYHWGVVQLAVHIHGILIGGGVFNHCWSCMHMQRWKS